MTRIKTHLRLPGSRSLYHSRTDARVHAQTQVTAWEEVDIGFVLTNFSAR